MYNHSGILEECGRATEGGQRICRPGVCQPQLNIGQRGRLGGRTVAFATETSQVGREAVASRRQVRERPHSFPSCPGPTSCLHRAPPPPTKDLQLHLGGDGSLAPGLHEGKDLRDPSVLCWPGMSHHPPHPQAHQMLEDRDLERPEWVVIVQREKFWEGYSGEKFHQAERSAGWRQRPGRGWLPLWAPHSPMLRASGLLGGDLLLPFPSGTAEEVKSPPLLTPAPAGTNWNVVSRGQLDASGFGSRVSELRTRWLKVISRSRCTRHRCPMGILATVTSGRQSPSKLCPSRPSCEVSSSMDFH